MAKTDKVENLVIRLRELEAAAIQLIDKDLSAPDRETRKIFSAKLDRLDQSHSHSWFGDHSFTYFQDFQTPGRSFNVEWGFVPGFHGSHNPGWRRHSQDEIRAFVFQDIGEDIFYSMRDLAKEIIDQFSDIRDQALDVMEALSGIAPSKAVARYVTGIESDLKPHTITDYVNGCLKSTPNMTRDSTEIAKGKNVPLHVQYLGPFQSLDVNRRRLRDLASTRRKTIEAVQLSNTIDRAAMMSNTVFIGHGQSEQWRVLKDFLKDRLGLTYEEFNRVSPAGIGTQERLSEMLERCGFAFLVFTAEDSHADKSLHARENVIHEAGLFQGKLGWRRAIVVLEEGCEEFSNIVGLGQVRFAKGNIATCFEEIRRVLEREEFTKA